MRSMAGNLSRILAEFIQKISYDQLPGEVIKLTKVTFLDWLGNAIVGSRLEPAKIIKNIISLQGGEKQATVIGFSGERDTWIGPTRTKSSVLNAVLANGTSSHIIELDDVHKASILHAGTVVIPGALALAEYLGVSGKKLIEAIVAGFDVCIRIGESVTPAHYRYFHTTGTAGTFGAAAAGSKLLNLSIDQTVHALGTAGTQAAGLWEFIENGSMSKHLHSGKAGWNGVLSAMLAKRNFTGAETILEGNRGFVRAMAEEYNLDKIGDGLGEKYKILENCFKIHSSCRHTHHAIDLTVQLVQSNNISSDEISQIEVGTYQVALDITNNPNPDTVYAAKFSLQFCVALGALHRKAGFADFTLDSVEDQSIRKLLSRVNVFADPECEAKYPDKWAARVTIHTVDGRTFTAKTDYPKGDFENPVSTEDLVQKFKGLVMPYVDECDIETFITRSLQLEQFGNLQAFFS
jgi:2-methylcitrate dehydratase PrpD